MRPVLLAVLAVLAGFLAGCVSTPDGGMPAATPIPVAAVGSNATVEMAYAMAVPPRATTLDQVAFWADGRPSAPSYVGRAFAHPDTFTAHDLLAAWSDETGRAIEYGYSDEYGFTVVAVDGVAQPVDPGLPPYWCYTVNGVFAQLAISSQPIVDGDAMRWEFGACVDQVGLNAP